MVTLDILIYALFAIVMVALGRLSLDHSIKHNSIKLDAFLLAYILFYVFICAIRWKVGVDSVNYALEFKYGVNVNHENNEVEVLWIWFVDLFHKYGIHFAFGLGACAFFQIFAIVQSVKEYRKILVMMPIVLFGSMFFLMLNNGVRQMIVACLFVYASRWIVQRKPIKYFLFVAITHFIHSSSIILLPFYFIPSGIKLYDKKWLCLGILMACVIIGLTPQFQSYAQYLEAFSVFMGYESYTDRVVELLNGGLSEDNQSFGLMKLSYLLSCVFVVYFGREMGEKYSKTIPFFGFWWFMSFLYGCLYFLVGSISYIFLRPVSYFAIFLMIMMSLLLTYLYESRKKIIIIPHKIFFWLYVIIIWVSTAWNIIKAHDPQEYKDENVTYKTILFHEIK